MNIETGEEEEEEVVMINIVIEVFSLNHSN